MHEFYFVLVLLTGSSAFAAERLGIGSPISPLEIQGWDIDVRGDGAGLPPGSGNAAVGQALFSKRCTKCHGEAGEGNDMGPPLRGGAGTLVTANPIKTIGSYWPFAPPIFDYVRRAMPLDASQSLTSQETYALTAYLLYLNDLLPDLDTEVSQASLPLIRMPNRDGFMIDDREKSEGRFWSRSPCMRKCAPVTP